jgi:hypothetical protein
MSVILHTVGHPDYHVVLVRNHNSRNHLRYRRVGCVLIHCRLVRHDALRRHNRQRNSGI